MNMSRGGWNALLKLEGGREVASQQCLLFLENMLISVQEGLRRGPEAWGEQEDESMETGWTAIWKQWKKDKFGKERSGFIDGEGKNNPVTKIPPLSCLVSSLT